VKETVLHLMPEEAQKSSEYKTAKTFLTRLSTKVIKEKNSYWFKASIPCALITTVAIGALAFFGICSAMPSIKSYIDSLPSPPRQIDEEKIACYRNRLFDKLSNACLTEPKLQYAYSACRYFDFLFTSSSIAARRWEESEYQNQTRIPIDQFIEQQGGIGNIIKSEAMGEDGSPMGQFYFTNPYFAKDLEQIVQKTKYWKMHGGYEVRNYYSVNEEMCKTKYPEI
jgi:hypothetical protein